MATQADFERRRREREKRDRIRKKTRSRYTYSRCVSNIDNYNCTCCKFMQ